MSNITMVFDADTSKFVNECLSARNVLQQVGVGGNQAGRQAFDSFQRAGHAMKEVLGHLAGFASLAGGIMALVHRIRAEWEHLRAQQGRAGAAQLTVAEARNQALLNLPAGTDYRMLDRLVAQTAAGEKVDQKRLWGLMSTLLSSKGALSDAQMAEAFRGAARVGAMTGEGGVDIGVLGGGIQDVMRTTGLGSAEKSLGWVMQFGTMSRMTKLDKIISNLTPVITGSRQLGSNPTEAARFLATMTMLTGDTEGDVSKTGTINFMKWLAEGTTESGAIIPTGKSTKEGKLFGGGGNAMKFSPLKGKTFAERLTELQDWYASAPEDMRSEFLGKLEGRGIAKAGFLKILSRDPEAMATMATVNAGLAGYDSPGVEKHAQAYFQAARAGDLDPVRRAKRLFSTFTEEQELGNASGMAGVVREELKKSLEAIPGVSKTAVDWAGAAFEFQGGFGRGDVLEAAVKRIEAIQGQFGYGKPYMQSTWSTSGMGGGVSESYLDQVPFLGAGRNVSYQANPNYSPQQAHLFEELIASLRALRDEIANNRRHVMTAPGTHEE